LRSAPEIDLVQRRAYLADATQIPSDARRNEEGTTGRPFALLKYTTSAQGGEFACTHLLSASQCTVSHSMKAIFIVPY